MLASVRSFSSSPFYLDIPVWRFGVAFPGWALRV
jgi:hypothetical protein